MKRKGSWARLFANALTLSMVVGICTPAATVFAAEGNDMAIVGSSQAYGVQEQTGSVESQAEAVESGQYVLMNIPYADFYRAEVGSNTEDVDAFTSATLNKTRTGSLVGGSYHVNSDGSDITGITYPVKIGDGVDLSKYKNVTDQDSVTIEVTNRGQTSSTTYNGKEALFENPSYSYYVLSQAPTSYKELTVSADGKLDFGPIVGDVTEKTGVVADMLTESSYGDYQLNLDGLFAEDPDVSIYAVVLKTEDGMGYGLRHMENIWRKTALSWCTGFTPAVHNCPTSSEHYKSMMGKTIKEILYYTSEGNYKIPVDVYVPVKFPHTLEVADASVKAAGTGLTLTGLPSDYNAQYSVDGLSIQVSGGILNFTGAEKGKYTLTVEDTNGHYAPLNASFELYTEDMPASYDAAKKAVVAADGFSGDALADYLKNITSVAVDGKGYAPSGRGAVVIIEENGTIKTDAEPLAGKESCEIQVTSTGYLPLTFTYKSAARIDTTALTKSIQAAERLSKSAYTAASYAKVETALKTAKDALAKAESQAAVEQAAKDLDAAVRALVKAAPKTGTTYTYKNIKYQTTSAAAAKAVQASNKSLTSAAIPATITIDGHRFNVTAVANKAFSGCKKLKTVQIGTNVTSIGTSAFADCTALTTVTVNSTKLTSIGKTAFSGDKKLATITLKTSKLTKAKIGANAFKNIKAACTFKVPAKKVSSYKTIFKAKGAGKNIKVKKL